MILKMTGGELFRDEGAWAEEETAAVNEKLSQK